MVLRIAYLASGAASSARGIHDAGGAGAIDVESVALIGNNSGSGALGWARSCAIPASHLSGATHPDPGALDDAICSTLVASGADLVVLSGYAKRVGVATLERFRGRILNVHPAPLPQFGGQGMYGLAVHEAVIRAGSHASAVTIHHVDEGYDEGAVVARWPIEVRPDDAPTSLRDRVHDAEPTCWVDLFQRAQAGERFPSLDLVGPG